MTPPPIVWSIAGTDSGGGAGLSADQRAADAFGVHLCPVVAAVTAQHSCAVTQVHALPAAVLEAQLAALADDMPPRVVKTGLLGGAAQVRIVARWVDRLRGRGPVALVVDPVLGASTGAAFVDADALQAYRDLLLPRATLVTPNRQEAQRLCGQDGSAPALARALRERGAGAVCVTGGDSVDVEGHVLDWLDGAHASGWLAAARVQTPHHHGTGCTFASAAASALALGFVTADAVVLAKMATTHALRHGYAAGAGAGPVRALPGFGTDARLLPTLSFGEEPSPPFDKLRAGRFDKLSASPASGRGSPVFPPLPLAGEGRGEGIGLYAIVDSAERVAQVLAAGIRTVQLRIKAPPSTQSLRDEIASSITACRHANARLFINDHWQLARDLGAGGVHLGQEDVLALGEDGRTALRDSGLALGVSSHSLWELCRARGLAARYVACGPVWPTLTKAMPWRAQGLANLAWWQHMAGAPVVAIGGILTPSQAAQAAQCGVDGVCVVRGLGDRPERTVASFEQAWAAGRRAARIALPALPHPALDVS
jgi:hydroxymethylpyrimidine kinase/phosphomethylpyrimidine kinase/thiamine-phosphate diphosphorylase